MSEERKPYKVPEGWGLTEWPEFKAMTAKFFPGKTVPKNASVTVRIGPSPTRGVLLYANDYLCASGIASQDAWKTPEMVAWLKRLGCPGVGRDPYWVNELSVSFAPGVFPMCTVRAALSDTSADEPATEAPSPSDWKPGREFI